jgi:hypothetical protein
MDASWVAPVATGVALLGYMEVRFKRLEDRLAARIDKLSEQYIRHLEMHAGRNGGA